jgi:CDP-glycerol glycerophosphotransferase (TagB/SpsB family)
MISSVIEKSDRIFFIDESLLASHKFDLYELLSSADVLITDYSSVYFDFLLLDKPIVFVRTDRSSYQSNRGFLVEPDGYWSPGLCSYTQEDIEYNILLSIDQPYKFSEERLNLSRSVHAFQDNESSGRVKCLLDKMLSN